MASRGNNVPSTEELAEAGWGPSPLASSLAGIIRARAWMLRMGWSRTLPEKIVVQDVFPFDSDRTKVPENVEDMARLGKLIEWRRERGLSGLFRIDRATQQIIFASIDEE